MEKLRVLKDPESMWSTSNPFQDFELSQQKVGKICWGKWEPLWRPVMERFLQVSSPEVRGSFPEMKAGGTEEGTLYGQEANVYFNLGLQ